MLRVLVFGKYKGYPVFFWKLPLRFLNLGYLDWVLQLLEPLVPNSKYPILGHMDPKP